MITSDTTFIAYFAPVLGIYDIDCFEGKVYVDRQKIIVEGSEGNTVTLYDVNGRMLATKRDGDMPVCFDVPVTGTYMIKIGNYPARRVVVIR